MSMQGSASKKPLTATAAAEGGHQVPTDPESKRHLDGHAGPKMELGKKLSLTGKKSDGPNQKHRQQKRKKPSKKKKVKRIELTEGDMVKSTQYQWKVLKKLGSGGFGDVYKVVKVENLDKSPYAMKTEMVGGDKRMLRLKIEVTVLEQCQAAEAARRKHFVQFMDKGICDKFKFVVMGLVGPSIEDIRMKIIKKDFTPASVMNIALQTLKAVADLHNVGWLHRDIKPQNFAVGLEEAEATIFMLDFGIARRIFNPGTRIVKAPRAKVKFLGTVRFASRACHKQQEQGRKDDLESWLYMVADLFDCHRGLPWKRKSEKEEVLELKEKFFTHKKKDFGKGSLVPRELWIAADYIKQLACADEPQYPFLDKALHAMATDCKIDLKKKAEWIGRKADSSSSSSADRSSDNRQSGSDSSSSETKAKSAKKKHHKPAGSVRKKKLSPGKGPAEGKNTKDSGNTKDDKDPKECKGSKETAKPSSRIAAKSDKSRKS